MTPPIPTPIYRITHIDNLQVCLKRTALHAPNFAPQDGLSYRTIHDLGIQEKRRTRTIRCGPKGVIHDYVSFYFGPRSPMLFQLHTGFVEGYRDRQDPIIYLVADAQAIDAAGSAYVFSDGHCIATFTMWFSSLTDLDQVDWKSVYARDWKDTTDEPDRQRRKQAEFLVHRICGWSLVEEIGVVDQKARTTVAAIMASFSPNLSRPVSVRPDWYY